MAHIHNEIDVLLTNIELVGLSFWLNIIGVSIWIVSGVVGLIRQDLSPMIVRACFPVGLAFLVVGMAVVALA